MKRRTWRDFQLNGFSTNVEYNVTVGYRAYITDDKSMTSAIGGSPTSEATAMEYAVREANTLWPIT